MSEPPPGELVDIHNHMIPGVDDGVQSVEEGIEGLARLREGGVDTVLSTPHINAGLTHEPEALARFLDDVDEAFDALREAASERHPGIALHRGHEVAVDVPDPDLSDERLRLAGTDFVLIEWPRFQIPPGTVEVLGRMTDAGYRPVIAHPERYAGMGDQLDLAEAWRGAGARLQVNHGSVTGRYGPGPRERALKLLGQGRVDYLATDFHGHPGSSTHLEGSRRIFEENDGGEAWRILSGTNPGRLIRGEDPLPVTPLRLRKGVWAKLMGIFGGET